MYMLSQKSKYANIGHTSKLVYVYEIIQQVLN